MEGKAVRGFRPARAAGKRRGGGNPGPRLPRGKRLRADQCFENRLIQARFRKSLRNSGFVPS